MLLQHAIISDVSESARGMVGDLGTEPLIHIHLSLTWKGIRGIGTRESQVYKGFTWSNFLRSSRPFNRLPPVLL